MRIGGLVRPCAELVGQVFQRVCSYYFVHVDGATRFIIE